MLIPYIHTSPREFVREASTFDNEQGITYREIGGEHSIWAARVPFLPAMMSADFTRSGKHRIGVVMQRQFRFIYDLVRAKENRATFEMRFIATPNPIPGQPNLIDILFLGKIFATRQRTGQAIAEKLWEKFSNNFPLEDPFNYPLEPVTDEAEFWRYYEPLPFDELTAKNLLEIRKHEDMPIRSMAPLGRVERKGDYIAHPFVPSTDFHPMGRFFAALATQPQKCWVSISLRPTRMFDQEVYNVSFAIGQFRKTATEDDDITEEYIRTRSRIGVYVYQQLVQEREQLVMVRVNLVGEHEAPRGLAEALGSEMMGNAENKYPTQWAAAQPADDEEFAAALNNLRYLEHDIWGYTIASPPLVRLRYLATAQEAYGAFRLPVPPESGYMPGVLVKNEPFVAPADELELRQQARANLNDPLEESEDEEQEKKIDLGMVYHRGNVTAQPFQIKVRDLTRHALIGGSTGSGKSTTIKHMLVQLWRKYRIPFLVLYPVDKPDYRDLRGFSELADDLLIFTLGDESTSPFRFNPFEVPEGLLLKTHLSRLMRVFNAAFTLNDPLPMIYREALRKVYRDKGWDTVMERGQAGRDYPIMSDFYHAIRQITDGLNYGREVQDNVRQASVIRIGDLLENAGYVVNVRQSMPLSVILNRPTIMEIGRVGSTQDTALLMGFLLMRFAEEVERNPRPSDHPHITVVEEAHRLMAEINPALGAADTRSAAGEDFSNILAEVRGHGEGIIIAEQIPTLLVKGAIGNTYLKLMHWLEDAPSFELFSNIMNLDMQQREYARTLTPGFALVRSPYGRPVHIKIPEFGDQPGFDGEASRNSSDEHVRKYMAEQRHKLGLDGVSVVKWDASLAASPNQTQSASDTTGLLNLLLSAPLQTCAFCQALHRTKQCKYGPTTRRRLVDNEPFRQQRRQELEAALAEEDNDRRWRHIQLLGAQVEARLHTLASDDRRGIVYCFLAHEINQILSESKDRNESNESGLRRQQARTFLQQFEAKYKQEEK